MGSMRSSPAVYASLTTPTISRASWFPISVLPVYLQYVSWTLPITHSLNGFRGAMHGASLAQLAPDALWLLIASAVLMPISLWLFARAVQRAKIDGTLGQY